MPTDRDKPRELELKLEIDGAAADRLTGHRLLRSSTPSRARLESLYFDTPGLDLADKGYSLRVRKEDGGFVQTLKQEGKAAGFFDRGEWERPAEGFEVDARALRDTPLARHRKLAQNLQPIGRCLVDRSSWRIERGGALVEVSVDRGRVQAGKNEAAVSELELELKKGDPGLLFDLARQLARSLDVRPSALSKGERVQRLANCRGETAEKAPKVELSPASSVASAFSAISRSCLRHFLLNEALIVEKCNEAALHQGRVAMRRLRAALSLFGGVIRDRDYPGIRKELRWFTASLGDARNLDVFLKRYRDQLSRRDRNRLLAARTKAYSKAKAAIESERFRRLMMSFLEWLETGSWRDERKAQKPIGPFAENRLNRLWTKWRRAAERIESLDEEGKHRLRIQGKKLRYAVEFLGSLFGRHKVRQFTKSLEQIQDSLGDINDRVTALELADSLSLDFRPEDIPAGGDRAVRAAARESARLIRNGPFWRSKG